MMSEPGNEYVPGFTFVHGLGVQSFGQMYAGTLGLFGSP
jgi:hypothetical protein